MEKEKAAQTNGSLELFFFLENTVFAELPHLVRYNNRDPLAMISYARTISFGWHYDIESLPAGQKLTAACFCNQEVYQCWLSVILVAKRLVKTNQ